MGLLQNLGFGIGGGVSTQSTEMPVVYGFPYGMAEKDFVSIDVCNIYSRILIDTFERTIGLKETLKPLLWDSCLASETRHGLISLLATAMTEKKDLFLVYKKEYNLIREADTTEQREIRADYQKSGASKVGVFVSFAKYGRTDMVKLYSALEYCTVGALSTSMNLSKAIQFKMKELRSAVGATDAEQVIEQAKAVAEGLKNGKSVLLDGEDAIETAKPDLTATQTAMDFYAKKRSFYLGMPASYLSGEASAGLGDSGNGDAKKVEQGLKAYFFSIVKPVVDALFTIKASFKSENTESISTALETLKTFEITSEEYVSKESKMLIVNQQFGLPEGTKGGEVETETGAEDAPNQESNGSRNTDRNATA